MGAYNNNDVLARAAAVQMPEPDVQSDADHDDDADDAATPEPTDAEVTARIAGLGQLKPLAYEREREAAGGAL